MGLKELQLLLNDSKLHTFYPLEFNATTKGSSTFSITGGTPERGGVHSNYIRILTRENHPIQAEEKAKEIRKYLYDNVKGAFFNGVKVISIETESVEPLHIGEEDGLYFVSYNYIMIMG